LLGGAIAMLRFGVFGYWANSYWGGNVAAIGGALLLGALPRIKANTRWQDATLMGIGLALLANSRPWEGLVLSLPVAVLLLWWIFGKQEPRFRVSLRSIVLPLAIILSLTAGWLMYYCWRTTGHALRPPYQVYEETYGSVPVMIWQDVRPRPDYRHPVLAKLEADQETTLYQSYFRFAGQLFRVFSAVAFFLGPILILPFLGLLAALPKEFSITQLSRRSRDILVILLIFTLGSEASVFYNPHYSAPATCLVIALILIALRKLRMWNRRGVFLARAVTVACVIIIGLRIGTERLHLPIDHAGTYYRFQFFQYEPKGWFPRAEIEDQLEGMPGNHLVIVRYSADHQPFPDWVYNAAEIDRSRVIWARDMSPAENQELTNYYASRTAWLLEPDVAPPRLERYSSAERTPVATGR
jgi:4-amino-4-deoxy-L-arabinose transferase-like glycosyltransferase